MKIIGITPGLIDIKSDIPFNQMQTNGSPSFWWDTPETNGVPIRGVIMP